MIISANTARKQRKVNRCNKWIKCVMSDLKDMRQDNFPLQSIKYAQEELLYWRNMRARIIAA